MNRKKSDKPKLSWRMKQFIKDPSSFSQKRINNLCTEDKLDDEFIEKYACLLNWNIISVTQNLSNKIIQKYSYNINWLHYFQYHEVTEEWIREFRYEIDWSDLCTSNRALSENFLREFQDIIVWDTYSRWKTLKPKFMEEVKDDYKFSLSLFHQKYSEEFLRKHIEKFTTDYLGNHYVWQVIPQNQVLSEQFIDEWKNIIDWDEVCRYQKLSEEFMEKHLDKLNWEAVSYNQKLSEEFIEKHLDKINIRNIITLQPVSKWFMRKHADSIVWINDLNFFWDRKNTLSFSKGRNKNLTKKFVIEMLQRESEREGIGNFTKERIKEKIKNLRGEKLGNYI